MTKAFVPKKQNGEELALRLLARRDYSQQEMHQKLAQKGIPLAEIEMILQRLSAAQLLDDLSYAQRLASYCGRKKIWGRKRILQKLKEKGIAEELAKEVVEQEERKLPAEEKLKMLVKKKLKNQALPALDLRGVKKLTQHLYRQGFAWEEIATILRKEGGFSVE